MEEEKRKKTVGIIRITADDPKGPPNFDDMEPCAKESHELYLKNRIENLWTKKRKKLPWE